MITTRWMIGFWLAAAAILCLRFYLLYPYTADDAFISMRYAERLLAGKGLTWNDGEVVEGYSNLLWVLCTAALGYLGVDLLVAVRALGMACVLLTPSALFWYARRNDVPRFAVGASLLAYVLAPPLAVWGIGGLEGPMMMLCFAWAAALIHALLKEANLRYALWAGVMLGLICLLRPEGPIYTIALMLPLMLCGAHAWRERIRLGMIVSFTSAAFFFAQMLFRWYYYGEIVANTVMAKVAFTLSRLEVGAAYVMITSLSFLLLWAYAIIGLLHVRRQSGDNAILWSQLALALPLAALVLVGGDIFPHGRPFLPLVPLFIFAFMDAASGNMRSGQVKKEKLFLAYVLAAHAWLITSPELKQVPQDVWVQRAAELGKALHERYADENPTVAVYAAGAISYYSKLPTLDVLGLTDRNLTRYRQQAREFGEGLMGHELFDGRYINQRAPEILAFEVPGLAIVCGKDLPLPYCDELMAQYEERTIDVAGKGVKIWVRKGSGIR